MALAGSWLLWFALLLPLNTVTTYQPHKGEPEVMQVLRRAADTPVGYVGSAVMLHSKLSRGMTLPQVLKLTGSLGREVSAQPEIWAWADAGADEVQVELQGGRVTRWELKRAAA